MAGLSPKARIGTGRVVRAGAVCGVWIQGESNKRTAFLSEALEEDGLRLEGPRQQEGKAPGHFSQS